MEPEWSVRRYQEGDENGIFELWQTVYPGKAYNWEDWLKWWKWLYRDNPAGDGWIWLADHNGRIAGHCAVIPVKVKIGSETVIAALGTDAMTHPDYRHQGIYETLVSTYHAELPKEGVQVIHRFANPVSRAIGKKKLGFFDIAPMKTMFKPLNWSNVVKLKVRHKFLQKISAAGARLVFNKAIFRTGESPVVKDSVIKKVSQFDDRVNDLWTKAAGQYQIMVVRDKDYLNWRYAIAGNYTILVAEKDGAVFGYLVLQDKVRNGVKTGQIFDLLAESPEVMHCLLSKTIEDCQQRQVDLLVYNLIADKSYYQVLRRNGFLSLPFVEGAPFCAYTASPSLSQKFLADPGNWFVQNGDSYAD